MRISDGMMNLAKIGTGVVCGLIAAELTCIGANAAADDIREGSKILRAKIAPPPEPVKKGLFRRRKVVK